MDMTASGSSPPSGARLLVVDDDPGIRRMLARYFEDEGFRVATAESGRAMFASLESQRADLVLLDLVLPGEDGVAIARELRAKSDIGIIMLTGRGDMVDRVVGLEVGADDYMAKPFHLREVLARVKSVLRRLRPAAAGPPSPASRLRFAGWCLDRRRRELTAPDGRPVPLTTGEFELLEALATNPGRALDRDRLMDLTKGRDWAAFDRSIDNQVSRLRKKIEPDPRHPTLVKSVRGVGYIFTPEVEED
jgi:two-component system phosphate regulon response regulator OmpR